MEVSLSGKCCDAKTKIEYEYTVFTICLGVGVGGWGGGANAELLSDTPCPPKSGFSAKLAGAITLNAIMQPGVQLTGEIGTGGKKVGGGFGVGLGGGAVGCYTYVRSKQIGCCK